MSVRKILKDIKEDKMSLYKRYLLWLYKMTKDEFDKIERKFTQLDIDRRIEGIFEKKFKSVPEPLCSSLKNNLKEWKEYVLAKEKDAKALKFGDDGDLLASYLFLQLKLETVEEIIVSVFSKKTLKEFKELCEEYAFKRILEDVSGRR